MLALSFFGILLGFSITGTAFILICLILLQKNRGSGLSGAFGGVGGHSAFGTKTGDFLTWLTVGLVALFLVLCIVGNFVFTPEEAMATPNRGTLTADTTDTNSDATDGDIDTDLGATDADETASEPTDGDN